MKTAPAAVRPLPSWSLLFSSLLPWFFLGWLGSCSPENGAPEPAPDPTTPDDITSDEDEVGLDRNPFRKIPMPSPTPDGAKVTFHQDTLSFGTLMDGDRRVLRFWFRSEGSEPLIMPRIKPSCGCTTVVMKARRRKKDVVLEQDAEWKTGAVGVVEMSLDTTSLQGDRKVFLRVTNNAQEDQIVLQAGGTVNPAFEIRPPWSEWRDTGSGTLVANTSVEGLLEEAVESVALVEGLGLPGLSIESTPGPDSHGRHWNVEARLEQTAGPIANPMQIMLQAQVRGEDRLRVFNWTVRLPE